VKKILMTMAMIGVSAPAFAETVQDVNKTVVNRVPYNVEVCTNQSVGGDKSGDMLKGAIIGGIIGNNVGNVDNGGALGAVLGGMIGHNNSNATGGTRRVCEVQTRYNEEVIEVYSHSIVSFYHNGKQYRLRFQK
jgi:uncharacterized protein YcfJ|tara:strand:+ start:22 stop:423 length:402 start_codon:yes stop_codon:yes gene_type:complete